MTGIERELLEKNEHGESSLAVDIYDQIYHLRGTDPAYIEQLAQTVDSKMRAVATQGGTVDSLRVAVLAALNLADELEILRERYKALVRSNSQTQTTARSRSASLSGMLDAVLDEPIRRAG